MAASARSDASASGGAGASENAAGESAAGARDAPPTRDSLILRVLSSLALGPAALIACWFGGPAFAALVAFLMVAMCFEWTRMVAGKTSGAAFVALAGGAAGAAVAAGLGAYPAAYGLATLGGLAAALIARESRETRNWLALAGVYICAPCVALLWLREGVESGRGLTILLFAVVWSADTGAYFMGRLIGGPRLSPVLSPAKTWAGAVGGVIAGGAAGVIGGRLAYGAGDEAAYLAVGGALGLISIVGDIVESAFKRRFGVKDISGFIPGHGGALDRLDGMIFATAAIALVLYGHILLARL